MKLLSKKVAFILSLTLICTTLISCSTTELKVLEAMMKSNEILSSEKDIEASVFIDIKGLPEDEVADFELVKEIINQSTLFMNYKSIKNKENTMTKFAIEGNLALQDMPMDFGVWLDLDLTNQEEPKFIEIIKQPALLTEGPTAKPYMVMDLSSSFTGDSSQAFNEILKSSVETNKFALSFIKEYAKDFKLGETLVSQDGTLEVDGETLPKYHLKIDDKIAKKFIRQLVNDMIDSGKAVTFFEQLMTMQLKNMEAISDDLGLPQDQPTELPEPKQEDIDAFKELFNEFMNKFDDVTLLGSNGIQIDYVINNDGYIIYESGTIDFLLNLNEITKAFEIEYASEESPSIIQLKLMYTINTKNINEDVTIEIPKLSHKNATTFNNMLNMSVDNEFIPEDVIDGSRDLNIYVNNKKVIFENKPLLVNGNTLAPIREVIESIGGEVKWVEESQTIIININDSVVELMIDDNMAFINGEPNMLEEPATLINNRTYIPVRYIAETIGGDVTWDASTSSIHITY